MSRKRYDVTQAKGARLELLAASPLFRVLAESLPQRPGGGRPPKVTPAVALFVGAAIVVYGSTRAADDELVREWPSLSRALRRAGYEVADGPPRSYHWEDYREQHLSDANAVEALLEKWRPVAIEMARDMGLAIPSRPIDWLTMPIEQILFGDGSWFGPASEIGLRKPLHCSRAKHKPRVVEDAVRQGGGKRTKTVGYPATGIGVRGPKKNQRIILDVSVAHGGSPGHEIAHVIERLELLLPLFEKDAIQGFVYDGAMNGKHHRHIRNRFGLLSVNNIMGFNQVQALREAMYDRIGLHDRHPRRRPTPRAWIELVWRRPAERKDQWRLELSDCSHRMGFQFGALWTVEHERPNLEGTDASLEDVRDRWGRPCRVTDVRRFPVGDRFRWEVDVQIPCPYGPHVFTFDPNGRKLTYWMRRVSKSRTGGLHLIDPDGTETKEVADRRINLAQQFGIVDQTRTHRYASVYGRRNDAESWNSTMKVTDGLGGRSRTYTRERFLLDILLEATIRNTLSWDVHTEPGAREAGKAA